LQTRKSIGGRHGSDEDDFKPIKAAAKRKAPSKAGPAKQNNDDEDAKEDGKQAPAAPKRKAVAKKPVKDESDFDDDDMEVVERPAPAPVPKRKAAAKKPVKDESDSDIEVQVVEKSAPKKPPVKPAVVDSDSEEVVLPAKSKGKGREVLKRK